MLQNIRDNSQGWIAKTIIGVIVLLLALTGFDAIFNYVRTDKLAVKINGTKVTQQELSTLIETNKRQLASRMDVDDIDEQALRQNILDNLIKRTLMVQNAQNFGFTVSKEMLDQIIVSQPEFQQDGKFSNELFDRMIGSLGYSRLQFRQMLTDDILTNQLRYSVAAGSFVTKSEIQNIIKLERQTRDFDFMIISSKTDEVNPTLEQLQEYYKSHSNNYDLPEQVIAEYIELNKASLYDEVSVSDEDVQKAYQAQIANLVEQEQRNASHILLEVNAERDEQTAKAQILQIAQRIQNGEDFAKVAQEVSEDFATANKGGDLGLINVGEQNLAFEQALFALKQGEISAPVLSDYGWHLIKVTQIIKPSIPKLEDLKLELETELKSSLAEQLFIERSQELNNLAYEAADLDGPAAQFNLTVQTSSAITRQGGNGFFSQPKIINALFNEEVLSGIANSSVLEVSPDVAVVVRVKEHLQARAQEFESVKDVVIQDFKLTQAATNAQNKGLQMLDQLQKGENVSEVKWQEVLGQTRRSSARELEGVAQENIAMWQNILDKIFTLPKTKDNKPYFALLTAPNNLDVILLKLNQVHEFDINNITEQELGLYRDALAQNNAGYELELFLKGLEQTAIIEHY